MFLGEVDLVRRRSLLISEVIAQAFDLNVIFVSDILGVLSPPRHLFAFYLLIKKRFPFKIKMKKIR